ncbi:MAG: acetyltransferase [Rhodobacteraceae bacterium]|nr:acetyltransferase [Paracoccaceae bacterium]
MSAKPVIIVGAGGHGRVLLDILKRRKRKVLGFVDAKAKLHGTKIDGVKVLGGDKIILKRKPATIELVNGIGNAPRKSNTGLGLRQKVFATYYAMGYRFATVTSPDAMVSASARLEPGAQIVTGAIVHPGAIVGANAIVNTGAIVDHDCRIGAHSHIAPGAVLSGAVDIGEGCHVGAGTVIVQGLRIGAGALIGAGAVVTKPVAARTRVLGVPARRKRSK